MRELKFRVWDNKAKKMSSLFSLFGEFTLLGGVHVWQEEFGIDGSSIERLNDLEIMQYTGLKDKNGKEIWEGDVVGWITPSGFVIDKEYGEMQVVTFFEGGFSPFCVKGWEVNPDPGEIEVLGNIYENNFEL